MASSDDEGEKVYNVSDYDFTNGGSEPISFAELPVDWNKSGTDSFHSLDGRHRIFLQGRTDNGLRKIYKQVISWTFDTGTDKPEILVLSNDGNWIKLLKPRHAFVVIIKTILITVHFIHYVKWNPRGSRKAMWDHFTELFSTLERRPSEDDLIDHMPLINEAVKRDETLAKSKLLSTILEKIPTRRKIFNEGVKSPFIVEDDENEDEDEIDKIEDDESDEEDDCFDTVCAICDNGGDITLCEGKCMRSFHATVADGEESECASLGFTNAAELKNVAFYCKNCERKQHQCFACGELGASDESSNPQVFRCGNGTCGHFYHPHCVAKLLHPRNEDAAKEHQERIVSGEQFACPVHRCYVCKGLEVRSEELLQFAICRRCPRAYHRKCLPRKITSEQDVDHARNIVQRAWDGLIPNRLLIYCLNHEIDPQLLTPARNHIKFPGIQQTVLKKQLVDQKKKKLLKKNVSSDDISQKKQVVKPAGLSKYNFGSKQDNLSRKRLEKFPGGGPSKKKKVSSNRSSHSQLTETTSFDSDSSLGSKLFTAYYGSDSEPIKSTRGTIDAAGQHGIHSKCKPGKGVNDSLTVDAETKTRIVSMMKDVSSSIALDQIKKRHKVPSTYTCSSKLASENITLGKVEGSVQAIRGAVRILEAGGSIEDAKVVCGDFLLTKITKWKEMMKVYLSPFLHGTRYTSFGRHFTKIDKLKEIIDMLHWYIQDGDTLVDFCCGSNDFSCLAKRKIDEVGKTCLFKNYDILQPKNDFNFERRDWMSVTPNDLTEGSRLIMGLNPPFGVNARLANKFVDKALEFKPKLLILIVPRETRRLDDRECRYDLIWEDDQMFSGKSFYLPGSIDANNNQIEDWNLNPPVLYLWSHPDWTPRHRAIALRHGHLARTKETHGFDSKVECPNYGLSLLNKDEQSRQSLVNKGEDGRQYLVNKGEDGRQYLVNKGEDGRQSLVNKGDNRKSPVDKGEDRKHSLFDKGEDGRQSVVDKGEDGRQSVVDKGDKRQSLVNKGEDRRPSLVNKGEDRRPSHDIKFDDRQSPVDRGEGRKIDKGEDGRQSHDIKFDDRQSPVDRGEGRKINKGEDGRHSVVNKGEKRQSVVNEGQDRRQSLINKGEDGRQSHYIKFNDRQSPVDRGEGRKIDKGEDGRHFVVNKGVKRQSLVNKGEDRRPSLINKGKDGRQSHDIKFDDRKSHVDRVEGRKHSLIDEGEDGRQSVVNKSDKWQSLVNKDEDRRQSLVSKGEDGSQSHVTKFNDRRSPVDRDEDRKHSLIDKDEVGKQSIVNKGNRRQSLINKGEDKKRSKTDSLEIKDGGTVSHHVHPVDENIHKMGHVELFSRGPSANRKRKQRSENRYHEDFAANEHSMPLNPSPNSIDARSDQLGRVHNRQDDFQQSDRVDSMFSSYSRAAYDGNPDDIMAVNSSTFPTLYSSDDDDDYLVRKYIPNGESRIAFHRNSSLEYDRMVMDQWRGYPMGITDNSRREVQNSWTERPTHSGSSFASSYRQLNPPISAAYGAMNTSAINRYASRLDELNPAQMNMAPRRPVSDIIGLHHPSVPRHGSIFPPGRHYP